MATYISKDTLIDRINYALVFDKCIQELSLTWLREYINQNDIQKPKHPGRLLFDVKVDIEFLGRLLKVMQDNERLHFKPAKKKIKNQDKFRPLDVIGIDI